MNFLKILYNDFIYRVLYYSSFDILNMWGLTSTELAIHPVKPFERRLRLSCQFYWSLFTWWNCKDNTDITVYYWLPDWRAKMYRILHTMSYGAQTEKLISLAASSLAARNTHCIPTNINILHTTYSHEATACRIITLSDDAWTSGKYEAQPMESSRPFMKTTQATRGAHSETNKFVLLATGIE